MPSVTLELTEQTPKAVEAAYFEAAKMQMEAAMRIVESEVRRLMPSRTGHLRRTLTHIVRVAGNTITGQVGATAFYGVFVDQGTGIYGPKHQRIYPVKAAALRFPEPGNTSFTQAGRVRRGKAGQGARFVYARSVKGVEAQHFMARAVDATQTRWQQKMAEIPAVAAKLLAPAQAKKQIVKKVG